MNKRSPATPARSPDFSAGASPQARKTARRQAAARWLRRLVWLLLAILAAVVIAVAALWTWAGSDQSLAYTLDRVAHSLPAEQSLETREVSGTLRSGGRIGWLRWNSPGMAVEIDDIALGWQLLPLLQRRVELGEVHAARVQITPQGPPSTEPPTPLEQLELPVEIGVPFRVDRLQWAGKPPVEATSLVGDYRYDGRQHLLNIGGVTLAQGRYTARATLQGAPPMALTATVDGTVQTTPPGDGTPLQVVAQATLKGTLATAAAQLQMQARLRPESAPAAAAPPASAAASSPAPAPAAAASAAAPASAAAASPDLTGMQADIQATLAPWAPQPLQQAQATLAGLNLAALWPQAPTTDLHGTVTAGPSPDADPTRTDWTIHADLDNRQSGPWDQRRLPLATLRGQARLQGSLWTVPQATATVGTGAAAGTATLRGQFATDTGRAEGTATLSNLRPDRLYSALAPVPLAGTLSATGLPVADNTPGAAGVQFRVDIRSTGAPAAAGRPRNNAAPAPLRIDALRGTGQWKPGPGGGSVQVSDLLVDALQARLEAPQLRVSLGPAPAGDGRFTLALPGATARASGSLGARAGEGELTAQWSDIDRTRRWLASLPVPGLADAVQGALVQGKADLRLRWTGGWDALAQQLQALGAGKPLPGGTNRFALQASLAADRLDITLPGAAPQPAATKNANAAASPPPTSGPTRLQLRALQAQVDGSLAQATLSLDGQVHSGTLRATLAARGTAGTPAPGQWQAQLRALQLSAQDTDRPGPWTVQLVDPMTLSMRTTAGARPSTTRTVQVTAGQARVTGPLPGAATLRWQPIQLEQPANGPLRLQTRGTLQGLPLAWVDALGIEGAPAVAGQPAQPLLTRLGLGGNLIFDGQWDVATGDTLRATASLRRASGDLAIPTGDTAAVTAVQSSGQGAGAGAPTATGPAPGMAGLRQAELTVTAEGEQIQARLRWDSARAGELDATVGSRLALGASLADAQWPADAPLTGTVRARLPDLGVWSTLAPPGWRVRGTLDANVTLSGTRSDPRWTGTLGADELAVRSVLDGVDLQNGRMRATLRGNQLDITEFRLQGGRGSGARIAGFSGNRTPPPKDGGSLTATGRITWGSTEGDGSGIRMQLQAQARELQVLGRADRQLSLSGPVELGLDQGQLTVRGKLTVDRATIILPEASAPTLGDDVVVRSKAKDREAQARAQAAAKTSQAAAQPNTPQTPKPPDIAITINLGRDFALQGQGITTRLTGELDIRSNPVPGAPPRMFGEVRTDQGRYRAWGQALNVENGLIRFNGPLDNPALDILALRPNISVRAGVQISGTAKAPRVTLYSDPELPDAEKLSWVVLGRNAASGGAEAVVLQQAALALLGRTSGGSGSSAASRLGFDEIGFKGPGTGEDASSAALTFGKRLSTDLYVTYERSLSGTLGTLYIFYDLTRRLTLRGQTGEKSAVDIIYTIRYD